MSNIHFLDYEENIYDKSILLLSTKLFLTNITLYLWNINRYKKYKFD